MHGISIKTIYMLYDSLALHNWMSVQYKSETKEKMDNRMLLFQIAHLKVLSLFLQFARYYSLEKTAIHHLSGMKERRISKHNIKFEVCAKLDHHHALLCQPILIA